MTDLQQAENERDNWIETARQYARNSDHYQEKRLGLQHGIKRALDELDVPNSEYPVSLEAVANAVHVLKQALKEHAVVDGYALHADDCPGDRPYRHDHCTCVAEADRVG